MSKPSNVTYLKKYIWPREFIMASKFHGVHLSAWSFRRERFGVDVSAWTFRRGRFNVNVSACTFRCGGFGAVVKNVTSNWPFGPVSTSKNSLKLALRAYVDLKEIASNWPFGPMSTSKNSLKLALRAYVCLLYTSPSPRD